MCLRAAENAAWLGFVTAACGELGEPRWAEPPGGCGVGTDVVVGLGIEM